MATDFNKPVVTDAYATLLPGLVQAHKDLARMLEPTLTGTHTNVPVGTVQWNATTVRWERYNGTSWVTLPSAGDNVYAISISGNAATTTALETARTIGGISFNGTANINLPGVNTEGNQNTSGNAATATKLATARTIGGVSFDGTANINLPGVNTTGNQNTTGNAATATLATNATTAASCSGNAATASAANNGYFTAVNSYPRLEIHKPGVRAGQWAIDASGNYVFENTNGAGVAASTLLTLTPDGVLSTSGGYSGNAATATKLASDIGSAPSYSCRAWVNFSGTGSVSIRASGNVSSITDNGVGDYTINFTAAMPDTNYAIICSRNNAGSDIIGERTRNTSAIRVFSSVSSTGNPQDATFCNVAVFR